MSKLTVEVPTVGEKDTTAEPKVNTALSNIESFLNGKKLDSTDNIKPEGINEGALTLALQEKLTTRLGFVVKKENASFEAENEKLYEQEKNGATVTLPKPIANRVIAVFGSAVPACKIKASEGKLFGALGFVNGATEIELTQNQLCIFFADGTNWTFIGESKRTEAYTAAKTFTKAESEAEVETSSTRPAEVILLNKSATEQMSLTVAGVVFRSLEKEETRNFRVNPGQKWKANQETREQHILL